MNYCPSCGSKIDAGVKFCPNCGRNLTGGTNVSFSFSSILENLSGLLDTVKNTLKSKTEASRITSKVTGLVYSSSEEKVISKLSAQYGAGFNPKSIRIDFTTHSIKIYQTSGFIKKKINIQTEEVLLHDISLNDIKCVYKQKSPGGNWVYYISTEAKDHPIFLSSLPYRFPLKLSTVLLFESNLYNVKLGSNERMVTIANGYHKKNSATIYITDKRILVTEVIGYQKLFGTKVTDKLEGTKLVLDIKLEQANIAERRGLTNADYVISVGSEKHTITFSKMVPREFLLMVPDARGNKDLLERQKKIKKGLKFFVLIAGLLSGSLDMDAEEIDVEDIGDDIDCQEVDLDGDGDVDAIGVDMDGDGNIDTLAVDCNNDGVFDSLAVDTNGDGSIDQIAYDTNGDGAFDEIEMDTDGDGVIDTAGVDTDGDGVIDTVTESDGYSEGVAQSNSSDSVFENYHDTQNRVMELDRQIMNTADPIQREALIREREFIASQGPDTADLVRSIHGI